MSVSIRFQDLFLQSFSTSTSVALDEFVGLLSVFDGNSVGDRSGAHVVGRLRSAHRSRDLALQTSPSVAHRRAKALKRRRITHFSEFALQAARETKTLTGRLTPTLKDSGITKTSLKRIHESINIAMFKCK